MDERKVVNNWNFGDIGANAVMLIILLGMAFASLVAFAIRGNVVALGILVFIGALLALLLGVIITLAIMGRVHRHHERMAEVERVRELADTQENLAIMKMMAEAQLAQQRAQGESWKITKNEVDTWRKMLSAGGNNEMVPTGFDFSDVDFTELEGQ